MSVVKISRGASANSADLTLARIMGILSETFVWILNLFLLLALFMFIFTILGMQLFGGKLSVEGDPNTVPDFNFDSFMTSLATVFNVFTGNKWTYVMSDTMASTSKNAALFFVLWIILSRWFIVSLLVAAIFSYIEHDNAEHLKYAARGTTRAVYKLEHSLMKMWSKISIEKWKKKYNIGTRTKKVIDLEEEEEEAPTSGLGEFLEQRKEWPLYFVHPEGKFRKVITLIVESNVFVMIIFAAIMVSSVALVFEAEDDNGRSPLSDTMKYSLFMVELVATVLFTVEVVLKWIAYAMYGVHEAYFYSIANNLDFFITIVSILSVIFMFVGLDF
jgi:hypothetical protein